MKNMITEKPKILLLGTCKGTEVIHISTIIRIQSMSNYSRLYFNNGKSMLVAKVLNWFEDKLPSSFVRVHRSHIINIGYIQYYLNSNNGKFILFDNTAVEISRRKKISVMKAFRDLRAA